MKTKELRNRISLTPSGHGHYKVTYTTPTGMVKTGITNDMQLIDRVKSDLNEMERGELNMTLKQALAALKKCTK